MAEESITKSLSIKETEHIARNRRSLLSCGGNLVYFINKLAFNSCTLFWSPRQRTLSKTHTLSHTYTHTKHLFFSFIKYPWGGKNAFKSSLEIGHVLFLRLSDFSWQQFLKYGNTASCMKRNICLREEQESEGEKRSVDRTEEKHRIKDN